MVGSTIILDSAAFELGSWCRPVTIKRRQLSKNRYLHDQLAVMVPVMLALTAAMKKSGEPKLELRT